MEKEKLLDKLKNFFKNSQFGGEHIFNIGYFVIFLISSIFLKNLFLLMVLVNIVNISYKLYEITGIEKKYINIINQLYLISSSYSFMYISNNFINSKYIYFWLIFLIFSIEISEYFLNKIFLDENSKKFQLIKFSINSIVSIIVGIIFSIFMKQKTIMFIVVNFVIYSLICIVHLFPKKYKENLFLKYYNTIAFPIIFIFMLLITGIIVLK